MSNEELLNHNEDNMRLEKKKKNEFDEKYDSLKDEDKLAGAAGVLDLDFVQI
jgi:hypothetical protein